MIECPKCGRTVESGAFICPGCDFILDTSFLGDDITDDEKDKRDKLARGKSAAFGADDVILGDVSAGNEPGDDYATFQTNDTGLSRAEVTHARIYVGGNLQALLMPEAVPETVPGVFQSSLRITPFEQHVLGFINGKRTVARIQKKSGMEEVEFKTALATLSDKGVIRLSKRRKKKKPTPTLSESGVAEKATGDDEATRVASSQADRTVVAVMPAMDELRASAERKKKKRPSGDAAPKGMPPPSAEVDPSAPRTSSWRGFASMRVQEAQAQQVDEGKGLASIEQGSAWRDSDVSEVFAKSRPDETGLQSKVQDDEDLFDDLPPRGDAAPRVDNFDDPTGLGHQVLSRRSQGSIDQLPDASAEALEDLPAGTEEPALDEVASGFDSDLPEAQTQALPKDPPPLPTDAGGDIHQVPTDLPQPPPTNTDEGEDVPLATAELPPDGPAELPADALQPLPSLVLPPLPGMGVPSLPGQGTKMAPPTWSPMLPGGSPPPAPPSGQVVPAPAASSRPPMGPPGARPLGERAAAAILPAVKAPAMGAPLPSPSSSVPIPGIAVSFEMRRKAEKIYEQAMKDQGAGNLSSARMNCRLATIYDASLPVYKQALAEIEAAIAAQGGGAGPKVNRPRELVLFEEASAAEGRGDYEKAVKLLQQAIDMAPKAAPLYNRLGVILATRLKRFPEATAALRKAIELEPGNLVYMNNFSKVTGMEESALEKDPKNKAKKGFFDRGMDKNQKVDVKKVRPKMF